MDLNEHCLHNHLLHMGCSSFSWETTDHKHLLGRTYDHCGSLENNRILIVPKHYPLKLEISETSHLCEPSVYRFLGMAVLGLESPIMVDGINEKGLMAALLHYPGYSVCDTHHRWCHTNIHPAFLVGYLLSQCSSVDDAVHHLSSINLTNETVFGKTMAVHYMLSDPSGEAAIVEPGPEGFQIHRNTIGVMTNSPDYLWHTTNLSNYISVTNRQAMPRNVINLEIAGLGDTSGSGFGLPGDYSSPSRFVRMALLKHYAVPGCDEIDGITRMFHLFASVDTPEGIVKLHPEEQPHVAAYEQTLCTCAMCAESQTYYFATAKNRRISAVSLQNEPDSREIRSFSLLAKQDISYLN